MFRRNRKQPEPTSARVDLQFLSGNAYVWHVDLAETCPHTVNIPRNDGTVIVVTVARQPA